MKYRRPASAVVALTVMLVLASLIAGAALDTRADGNDTRGLLDVRRVEVFGRAKPRFKTITFGEWRARRIWDRGYGIVYIDARGGNWFEHYAFVYSDGSRMQGLLYRHRRKKSDYVVSTLSAWKPNRRSVTVRVPVTKLRMPEERTHLRWFVKTLFTGRRCRRVCIDRVPNRGSIRTVLVPSPSPTITPTQTPLPTPTPTPTATE